MFVKNTYTFGDQKEIDPPCVINRHTNVLLSLLPLEWLGKCVLVRSEAENRKLYMHRWSFRWKGDTGTPYCAAKHNVCRRSSEHVEYSSYSTALWREVCSITSLNTPATWKEERGSCRSTPNYSACYLSAHFERPGKFDTVSSI